MVMSLTRANRYPAKVFWSDEDEGFVAVAEDLPGCSAVGDTQNDALEELQDAIDAWIMAAEAAGNRVPSPSISAPSSSFSGKVLLRMPRQLHAQLVAVAARESVSLNQYIVYLIATQFATQQVTIGGTSFFYGHGQTIGGGTTYAAGAGVLSGTGTGVIVGGVSGQAGLVIGTVPGGPSFEASTAIDWNKVRQSPRELKAHGGR
jgi:antitoxin HicB